MATPSRVSTVVDMRRFAIIVVLMLAASVALSSTPAAADGERYSVESQISLGIVDDEGWLEDEHCGFGGRTSQELVQSNVAVQLGTGQPEISYRWNQGPFRDSLGRAITYFCGDEVSVCFHPARVTVSANGAMTITMLVKLFEGDGDPFLVGPLPCYGPDQIDVRSVTLAVPAGTRGCLGHNVHMGDPNGDRLTIGSFCASATRLTGPLPPPPPVQPVVTSMRCDSLTARFLCNVSYTDSSGTTVTIRWHVNGTQITGFNNRQSINGSCAVGSTVSVRVVVANAAGGSVQRTTSLPCMGNAV
jgi:hypothetical protein